MSDFAKLVKFTPLIKPNVPSSPTFTVPLAPRNVSDHTIHESLKTLPDNVSLSNDDMWLQLLTPAGFVDESSYYFPSIDPPMDPKDIEQFTEMYFNAPQGETSMATTEGALGLIDSHTPLRRETTPEFSSVEDSPIPPYSPEEVEQLLSALTQSEWPSTFDTTVVEGEVLNEISAAIGSIEEGSSSVMDTSF
ncbi:hypothetical protein C8R42DRAFT_637192 [Lentinula raphanica]|nr:hypothetical protein C8R42DRAFT_637192 [Lentinula raphanica]